MEILYAKFDGSQLPSHNKGTAACVLYTKSSASTGTAPRCIRTANFNISTSGEAEFAAFLLCLDTILAEMPKLFSDLGAFSLIRIYGDSQVLFKHVRGTTTPSCPRTALLASLAREKITELKRWGCDVEMYWTPRKNNILADILCRTAYCLPARSYNPYKVSPSPLRPSKQRKGKPTNVHEGSNDDGSSDPSDGSHPRPPRNATCAVTSRLPRGAARSSR